MTSAAPVRKPYRKAPPQHREIRHDLPVFRDELDGAMAMPTAEPCQESLSDTDRIKVLQQQNEDLRRRLTYTTHKMEAMETEFESSQHYMEAEMGRTKDELEKMKDKFRRLQNSYTASQRTNQDLEDKLHALLRRVENDKKTMDREIVELTNKLLDAKNTIDKLEELNLPYELQDMVNKHMKISPPDSGQVQQDLSPSLAPTDVVPTSVIARVLEKPEPLVLNSAQSSSSAGRPVAEDVFVHVDMTGQQADRNGQGRDSSGQGLARGAHQQQQNGMCGRQGSVESLAGEEGGNGGVVPSFEKLNPYPTPPPPHPLYPGRKVIEFSTDDKVKIPKNSPLPNCTYATRQAISLSLVQGDDEEERQRTMPNSPAVSEGGWRSGASSSSGAGGGCGSRCPPQQDMTDLRSTQSSPFSSPPQAPSALASSASSEEDILSNWQRMFVEKMAPSSKGTLVNRTSFSSETANELQRSFQGKTVPGGRRGRGEQRGAYSDGEESSAHSWTVSRESSLDTDNSVAECRVKKGHYNTDCSHEESERLLMAVDTQDDGGSVDTTIATTPMTKTSPVVKTKEYVDIGSAGSSGEEQDILPQELTMIAPRAFPSLEEFGEKPPLHHITTTSSRPQKSPKRMGVHHLHRKDSLTRAQEHGNLLD
ncbi:tight junction-associated protein 1-like isoform X2 [Acipenser ruthenus]|uniref:tight junction-associated protein 1-like isoform X2 n=1 Tax=Acipenser ruthenus TaxID=7906 RepID=UPI00274216B6|nr:tight junction-associated protein 1-like isoform X2 [Acipenser ruthenus]